MLEEVSVQVNNGHEKKGEKHGRILSKPWHRKLSSSVCALHQVAASSSSRISVGIYCHLLSDNQLVQLGGCQQNCGAIVRAGLYTLTQTPTTILISYETYAKSNIAIQEKFKKKMPVCARTLTFELLFHLPGFYQLSFAASLTKESATKIVLNITRSHHKTCFGFFYFLQKNY